MPERCPVRAAAATALALGVALTGCHAPRRPPPPVPHPHYVLESAYQTDGHWFYPLETDSLELTGLGEVASGVAGLTADGEAPDPGALTAAMQTVPLPSIALVTNLATGRAVLVRVNDRGPASPARVIAVSPRAAALLGMRAGAPAPVRVALDAALSERARAAVSGTPSLAVQTAPRGAVIAEALPPPGGGGPAGPARTIGGAPRETAAAPLPERLPEQVRQFPVGVSLIYLDAGRFGRFEYANARAARLSRIGGEVVTSREGRQQSFGVRAGPFRTAGEADAALAYALGAGVPDAKLVIE